MKKIVKIGSMLVTLSLLLSVIPGMTVKAATTYYIYCSSGTQGYNSNDGKYEYTLCTDAECTIPANITTLSGGDIIEPISGSRSVEIYKDGIQISLGTAQQDIPEGIYTYEISALVNKQNRGHIDLTTYNPSASTPGNDAKAEDKHEHNWEWVETREATMTTNGEESLCCTLCGARGESREMPNSSYGMFCKMIANRINNAAENEVIDIESDIWFTMPKYVMEALKARRDVTLNLTLKYQNQKYQLRVPAGYDMSVLEEADWYGVLYLNQFFGVAE